MSAKAVTQFFQRVATDESIQNELIAIAGRNGFDFTSDELRRRMGAGDMELSDADLDGVAGGVAKKKKPAKKKDVRVIP